MANGLLGRQYLNVQKVAMGVKKEKCGIVPTLLRSMEVLVVQEEILEQSRAILVVVKQQLKGPAANFPLNTNIYQYLFMIVYPVSTKGNMEECA